MAEGLYEDDSQTNTEESTDTTETKTDEVSADTKTGEEKAESTETAAVDESSKADETVEVEEIKLEAIEDSKLTDADVKRIEAFAKDRGLNNEAANELLKNESKSIDDYAASQLEKFEAIQEGWVSEIKSDKEFGGEKFSETAEFSKRAAERFLSEDFREALDVSGWGNHPELVKGFARIGRAMENDGFVHGKSSEKSGRSMEDKFYGSKD